MHEMSVAASDGLYVLGGLVLLLVAALARARRRARMTPEQRGLDDVAYEIRQTRREYRWRR